MDWLENLSPLVKLGVVFALMLLLVRRKVNVGWALCLGAVICGFWFGQGPSDLLRAVVEALTSPRYVVLVLMILLILVLNHTLKEGGQIKRIVDSFLSVVRRPRTTLVFFPALLGLLPMPGGALFSAPMVETAGRALHVSDRDKTIINYWFRHVWEYSWPLYPGILLAAQFSGYSILWICVFQAPLMVVVILMGYLFFVRHLKAREVDGRAAAAGRAGDSCGGTFREFLGEASPIWLVIVLFGVFKAGLFAATAWLGEASPVRSFLVALPKNVELPVAITITIIYAWRRNRMKWAAIGRVLWRKDMLDNVIIALGIIVFGGILAGSGAAGDVAATLRNLQIPTWVVAMVLPFVVGLITGITMNMVLLTYQIILFMVHGQGDDHLTLAYICLAFACGYAGILLTPIHICMVQSNHYFKLQATTTLRRLVLPVLGLMVTGLVLFKVYCYVFPLLGWGPGTHLIPATNLEAALEAVRRASELAQ
ncbi:MAG: DUF401 family protein [Anaerolineaceae bacterium]|nr:DUF401 family protein [Anaerolineaceae bacterium]